MSRVCSAFRMRESNTRPCRRCSGPWSPSKTALWSCVGASGIASRPSHSAMKLTSSPRRNSSITSRPFSVPSADSASARSCAITTPFPPPVRRLSAPPGNPNRSSACRASSALSTVTNSAVGISALHEEVLCENLAAFELRRLRRRTDDRAARAPGTGRRSRPPAEPPARPP